MVEFTGVYCLPLPATWPVCTPAKCAHRQSTSHRGHCPTSPMKPDAGFGQRHLIWFGGQSRMFRGTLHDARLGACRLLAAGHQRRRSRLVKPYLCQRACTLVTTLTIPRPQDAIDVTKTRRTAADGIWYLPLGVHMGMRPRLMGEGGDWGTCVCVRARTAGANVAARIHRRPVGGIAGAWTCVPAGAAHRQEVLALMRRMNTLSRTRHPKPFLRPTCS